MPSDSNADGSYELPLAEEGKNINVIIIKMLGKHTSLGGNKIGDVPGGNNLDRSDHLPLAKKGKCNYR